MTVVRDAIDHARLPWIRPLVSEYTARYERVASLFAGNPMDPAAWRDTIARVTGAKIDRSAALAALARQLERRGSPAAARAAAELLAAPGTVAIVTGQQAGLFGGPLYTLLKAVTTVRLARHVSETYGVQAVPVFWIDAEDHDWAEIKSARLLDRDGALVDVTAADVHGAGRLPVGRLTFDASITGTIDQLERVLATSEYTPEVLAALRSCYRPGSGVGSAFAQWIETLLGGQGLVVFEADDPAAKSAASDVIRRELSQPRASALAREAGAAMAALGHAPQVQPVDDSVALFYLDENGRKPIRRNGQDLLVGDAARSSRELQDEAAAHPERFGPNVLLRPVVQDRLFPTICYVAGPSELAYQAQLGGVYREWGIEAPLLYNRASATILDSGAARFFERSHLPLEALQPQDDGSLNKLLESQLPADLERGIAETGHAIQTRVAALKASIQAIDPTLGGVVDTTVDRMNEALKTLQSKTVQAAKRKDETLRRQFTRTRTLVFPGGAPQERALSVAFFANRYGLSIGARLLDVLPLETDKHVVITL